MRTIDYDEWKKQKRLMPPTAQRRRGPGPRHRPRDPDEWEALLEIGLERRRQYLASGKLELLPDGGYRFEIGRDKLVAWLRDNE